MDFNQPSTLPTDQETQNHINNLAVQIADKEAQIVRLGGVITSNQYTIQQLANQKAELETQVAELSAKTVNLKDDLSDLADKIATAVASFNEVTSKSREIQNSCDLRLIEVANEELAVSEEKIAVKALSGELKASLEQSEAVKQEYETKLAKLRELTS